MAELNATPVSSCCSSESQATCCEPSDKEACCGTSAAGGSCGCSAGLEDIPLTGVGLVDVDIHRTHRVHEHAGSAIIRARKPAV